MKLSVIGLAVLASSLTGCPSIDDALTAPIGKAAKEETDKAIKPVLSQLSNALLTIDQQAQRIEQLDKALVDAKTDLKRALEVSDWINESYRDDYKAAAARLGADSSGYSVARTSLGPAVVRIAGISPYLDGYKVKLWVTVLTPIDLSGLKGSLIWHESDSAVLEKNKDKLRKKEFSTTATMKPGRYTEIEIAVTPASATGLKNFSVALETDQISVGYPPSGRQ